MLDVIIIGSGWGGLCTLKHCLEEKLSARVLEMASDYGGIWNIKNTPSVYANTYSVTSKYYLSMSDFPIPESYPEFPHHTLVMEYMKLYAQHFDLEKHISFNSKVIDIKKKGEKWVVRYSTKNEVRTLTSTHIALCTGQNSKCLQYPDIDTSLFKGKILHAVDYDDTVKNECLNKRVLIYGGSDTAFDIALELVNSMYTKKKDQTGETLFGSSAPDGSISSQKTRVYLSMRKGRWIQRRSLGAHEPADMFYSRLADAFFKFTLKSNPFLDLFTTSVEFFWGKSGSGVPEWETSMGYLNGYYVKSADILSKISFGDVMPLRDISKVRDSSVVTVDGKNIEVDVILFATGYKGMSCYTWIPEDIRNGRYYDHLFLIEDPTVAKVGFIRPYLTSIPMIIEMQSRYVAKVFSKKLHLPGLIDRIDSYNKMKNQQSIEFKDDYERVNGIIDPYDYMNMIGSKLDLIPSFLSLLLTDPTLLYYIIVHSWSHFIYRLKDADPSTRKVARQHILRLQLNGTSQRLDGIIRFVVFCILVCLLLLLIYKPFVGCKRVHLHRVDIACVT